MNVPSQTQKSDEPKRRWTWVIADFMMCYLAFSNLIYAMFNVVSLNRNDSAVLVAPPGATFQKKLAYTGIYFGLAAVGFLYMLGRYNWICSISTLLKLTAFCCVVLGLAHFLEADRTWRGFIAFEALAWTLFVYCILWSRRPKG